MPTRPLVIAFDVVETVVSLERLRARLSEAGQPGQALELWFARLLRNGFALAASGAYQPFGDVATAALAEATGYALTPADMEQVVAGFRDLAPHPDAEPAMRRATDAGVRVIAVTNGSAAITGHLLRDAGLEDHVERVVSIDEVRAWKPAPAVYRHAAEACEVPPERMALVAAHSWDTHGARRAGLVAGWVSRLEGRYPEIFDAPDVSGKDLVEVVDGLLALPAH
ncbi:MAG: haloacid dehalogenase type II [Carbonactinosporaceae bacterium]